MKKNIVYMLLIMICVCINLFVSLYVNEHVTVGPNLPYVMKNIFQLLTLILIGVFSTQLYNHIRKDRKK